MLLLVLVSGPSYAAIYLLISSCESFGVDSGSGID